LSRQAHKLDNLGLYQHHCLQNNYLSYNWDRYPQCIDNTS